MIQIGIGNYGRRQLVLAPKPRRCPACLTDIETGVCPVDCPERNRRKTT